MRTAALTQRPWLVISILGAWLLSGCAALSTVPTAPAAAPTPAAAPPPTTAQAGATTVVAVAPPAQPCCKQTLPEWLGLTGCCAKITKLLGAIPGLVGIFAPGLGNSLADTANKPPLLPVNSPQNLQSSNPAIQTAAQVQNEENEAPQKIAAIQYLATIGCGGCYPDVESALLASLDDCTESVRYAAAKALHDSAGQPCRFCNSKACCSNKVREKLTHIAYDMKDETCHVESSARVRRMARLSLLNCSTDPPAAITPNPQEGPSQSAPHAPSSQSTTPQTTPTPTHSLPPSPTPTTTRVEDNLLETDAPAKVVLASSRSRTVNVEEEFAPPSSQTDTAIATESAPSSPTPQGRSLWSKRTSP